MRSCASSLVAAPSSCAPERRQRRTARWHASEVTSRCFDVRSLRREIAPVVGNGAQISGDEALFRCEIAPIDDSVSLLEREFPLIEREITPLRPETPPLVPNEAPLFANASRYGCRYTTPPFMTNCTCATAEMSASGFPGTAMTSAK
jgi:hypothetical protein